MSSVDWFCGKGELESGCKADGCIAFEGLAHPFKLNVEGTTKVAQAKGGFRDMPQVKEAFAAEAAAAPQPAAPAAASS